MPDKHEVTRGIARIGGRVVAGLVVLAVAAGVVTAAIALPWPTLEVPPASAIVAPTPSEQQRVCPGPVLALAEDSSQAQAATSVGRASSIFDAWSETSGSVDVTRSEIDAVDNLSSDTTEVPEEYTVPAPDGATVAPLVAGSQSQILATETLTGLAVAACTEAASDTWLVGGSTDVGRSSLVLLSNPTTVLATVTLTVYGETGVVDAPGASGILVQPGEQRIISLAGLAPNLISPIVNVQATGGQVAATLQQSSIRGIEPGGVDLIGATGVPALEQTIAGLNVTIAAAAEQSADPDAIPSVRLMAVGDTPATVQVGVTSAAGTAAGSSTQVELEPGIATQVPFPDLAVGSYSVQVTSDEPVVAAARTSTVGTAGRDFAWYPSSSEIEGDFLVSVAAGPSPTLHLVNMAATDVDMVATPNTGETLRITVAAGARADLAVAPSVNYVVTGGESTVASVGYVGDGQLASFTLNPAGPLAEAIRVYLH
ncbi:hypothetical protein D6T64_13265 [Cryobacterium melibiosiphilum]|uniref:Large extracellular alpha-helical protein n=1 Tax=Cryobacterium melibiosiphilum TaxID=995039 RepID=A0A3A5MFD4_9MICO|nr:DUF5719 family protein [Cryobacterium melibiosiphilum]RJT87825.1 hypothetical protein D6T64_13265 [Cryobacterium melibiosiphilum]